MKKSELNVVIGVVLVTIMLLLFVLIDIKEHLSVSQQTLIFFASAFGICFCIWVFGTKEIEN